MTDPIDVMARAGIIAGFMHVGASQNEAELLYKTKAVENSQVWKVQAKAALKALTAAGYVITTQAEIDGIRAAAMKEAADVAYLSCLKTNSKNRKTQTLGLVRGAYDTEYANDAKTAILALTTTPPGWVCVPVGDIEKATAIVDELDSQMVNSLDAYMRPLWPEEAALVVRTFRAMTVKG